MAKRLLNQQNALHEQLKELADTFSKKTPQQLNKGMLNTYLELIYSVWDQIQKGHMLIIQKDTQEVEEYIDKKKYSESQNLYIDIVSSVKEMLSTFETVEKPATQLPAQIRSEVKLPKISIPKFGGSYTTWRSFHDLFKSIIHEGQGLSRVQKLQYLKSSVTGEAERLLRQFDVTDSNYEKAWEFLQKRYNNKRVLITTHLTTLFNTTSIKTESAQAIKALLDETEESLHELRCLGSPTDSWDPVLIHFLTKRLPAESHYKWEQEQGDRTDPPSYKEFVKFLEARFRTLEAIQSARPSTAKVSPKSTQSCFLTSTACPKCKSAHPLHKCPQFQQLAVSNRLNLATKLQVCKNCLVFGHATNVCKSKHTCYKCQKKHHTLLHLEPQTMGKQSNGAQSASNKPVKSKSDDVVQEPKAFFNRNHQRALLATAIVNIPDKLGELHSFRALVDSGSQVSFISDKAVRKLQLHKTPANMEILGLGSTPTTRVKSQVNFTLHSHTTTFKTNLSALVLNNITDNTPPHLIDTSKLTYLLNLNLADPGFATPGSIDLLLGADIFAQIIENGIIKGSNVQPTAQNTQLGWILMGSLQENSHSPKAFTIQALNTANLDEQLRRFWEQEELPTTVIHPDDERCEEIYQKTHHRLPNGQYQVQLPFRDSKGPELGNSRNLAVKQFLQLEKRFEKNPTLKMEYKNCIEEYQNLHHLVETPTTNLKNYYLPHHAVVKESSTTTKVRIVFNASAQTSNGKSLNEQLLVGPTIQPTLWAILLRWRQYKFAISADIEKMYRMIQLHPQHQRFQRIIWRDNPTDPLKDYQLTTVTFGCASAPFLAIRTLQQLATDEERNYPEVSKIIHNDFYVDDLLTGAHDISSGVRLQQQLKTVLALGGFNLRKWAANHPELLQGVSIEDKEITNPLDLSINECIKTLGIKWCPNTDKFSFNVSTKPPKASYTKRVVLSEAASLFDPLGWLAPYVIMAKIFIQKLWLLGLDWDEEIPTILANEWKHFKEDLPNIEKVEIPRWNYYSPNLLTSELHGFCDASIKAYAAVIYLRTVCQDGTTQVCLLTSKTRVAPTKTISLPKLELCGALLMARLLTQVKTSIGIQNLNTFAWTDSEITLAWIHGQPSRWKTFVANRVAEIQQLTSPQIWKHISSKDNPADGATRGVTAADLASFNIWWHGPQWLQTTDWAPTQGQRYDTTEETRKVKSFTSLVNDTWLEKYSTFTKLVRITAYCLRLVNNVRLRPEQRQLASFLSTSELYEAELQIIKMVQRSEFSEEYHALENERQISSRSRLLCLNPFLDKEGVIRVGGRLDNTTLSYNQKHPIILPNRHHVTRLIITHTHMYTLHGGTQLTLNTLRNKYWLLNARNTIRFQIQKCITCWRNKPKLTTQIMSNLPKPRVNPALPFEHTGVDYAGPIDIKSSKLRNAKILKGYLSIFVCLCTKAIHIEIVTDLSSQTFIAALKRFISRRGLCSHIYSDCGTNFIGASKEISKVIKHMPQEITKDKATSQITWHFNPPSAPHFGGLWEANVKLVKTHLNKTLKTTNLTYEELLTVLCQIEACVNSRPLVPMSNDPTDFNVLTPGHFLTGRNLLDLPHSELNTTHTIPIKRWNYVQSLTNLFWKQWTSQYLHTLQNRPKWKQLQSNLKIGDLVIIADHNVSPFKWPLGRIINTFPGPDNNIRVV